MADEEEFRQLNMRMLKKISEEFFKEDVYSALEKYRKKLVENKKTDHGKEPELHVACRNGNVYKICDLLKKKVDVKTKNATGQTALMLVCIYGDDSCVDLLYNDSEINAVDNSGKTALIHAIINKKFGCAEALFERPELDTHIKDKQGLNALYYLTTLAIFNETQREQTDKLFKALIDDGCSRTCVDKNKKNILHNLAHFSEYKKIKYLLKRDPMFGRCVYDTSDIVKFSTSKLSTRLKIPSGLKINDKDSSGMTPITLAALHSNALIVDTLIFYGADLNQKDNVYGYSAVQFAIMRLSHGTIYQILNCMEKADIPVTEENKTILHLICGHDSTRPIDDILLCLDVILRSKKIDINVQDIHGDTALHTSALSVHPHLYHSLIENGANKNIKNKKGYTAEQLFNFLHSN